MAGDAQAALGWVLASDVDLIARHVDGPLLSTRDWPGWEDQPVCAVVPAAEYGRLRADRDEGWSTARSRRDEIHDLREQRERLDDRLRAASEALARVDVDAAVERGARAACEEVRRQGHSDFGLPYDEYDEAGQEQWRTIARPIVLAALTPHTGTDGNPTEGERS